MDRRAGPPINFTVVSQKLSKLHTTCMTATSSCKKAVTAIMAIFQALESRRPSRKDLKESNLMSIVLEIRRKGKTEEAKEKAKELIHKWEKIAGVNNQVPEQPAQQARSPEFQAETKPSTSQSWKKKLKLNTQLSAPSYMSKSPSQSSSSHSTTTPTHLFINQHKKLSSSCEDDQQIVSHYKETLAKSDIKHKKEPHHSKKHLDRQNSSHDHHQKEHHQKEHHQKQKEHHQKEHRSKHKSDGLHNSEEGHHSKKRSSSSEESDIKSSKVRKHSSSDADSVKVRKSSVSESDSKAVKMRKSSTSESDFKTVKKRTTSTSESDSRSGGKSVSHSQKDSKAKRRESTTSTSSKGSPKSSERVPSTSAEILQEISAKWKIVKDPTRLKCREFLKNALLVPGREPQFIEDLATKIENCIYDDFKETSEKYKHRVRSRVLNLKDSKNPTLRTMVLEGSITPAEIAAMSAEDMASDELKKLREKFAKEAMNQSQLGTRSHGAQSDMYQCSECEKRNTTYYQIQILPGDEPMTTYVTCNECGHRWKHL